MQENPTSENLASNFQCVKNRLETLRDDSQNIFVEQHISDSLNLIAQSIRHGVGQSQDLIALVCCFQNAEMEKQELKRQMLLLQEHNTWLQEKLQMSEILVAQLEEEKKHYEFLATTQETANCEHVNATNATESTSLVELFPEDDDQIVMSQQQIQQIINQNAIQTHIRTLRNLVDQFVSQGRYDEAIPICKQSIQSLEQISGHNHPEVASMLNILAFIYRDQNNYKDAINLLNEALVIRKRTLGENHPSVTATLNNLAVLYGKGGKYREAEVLCREALEIRVKTLGENHIDVAKQLNNLALLCQNQGKYEAVEVCYQRALQIYETTLGPNHPNAMATKMSLNSCFLKQRKFKEANMLAAGNYLKK